MKVLLSALVICASMFADRVSATEFDHKQADSSPYADGGSGYSIICPLFTVMQTGEGNYLEYCNAYPDSCDDIPDNTYSVFYPERQPCDCPDTSGCLTSYSGPNGYNTIRPLVSKLAPDGLPLELNKKIMVSKAVNAYFMKDDEPIYVRLFEFVYLDKEKPQNSRSFVLGCEMKSPITGIEGLKEIKNWQSTTYPHVFTVQGRNQTILLIRAAGVPSLRNQEPTLAKTHE